MESIGRLAGGIAHDFNNLLTAIIGNAELISIDLAPDHPARREVAEILAAGRRASELTHQLLAFARRQIIEPRPVRLNELILDMDRLLRRLIGEDIDLLTMPAPDLGLVLADPGQIEQILVNLVVNSRDAMPQGGKLTIETANVSLDESYATRHSEAVPGDYVMLAVSDTGCGMDNETRARIFEPFFTTKESGQGTGLGLATCYGIVKQSGGQIWLYSEPGKGTAFKIYLPRLAESALPGQETNLRPGLLAGSETILLVEDENAVRTMAQRVLERHGYAVLAVANGREAIDLVAAHDGTIDLLVTDVVMPEVGGRDLAEHLSCLRPGIRVLFTSGYTDDAIVHHGVLDEGVAFLQKPFTPDGLARKVREVLDA